MRGSARHCATVVSTRVSAAAVMEIALRAQRYVAGGFVVGTINANLHAIEVPVLLVL